MAFLDFTHKYWWKNFIHKMYSWGAAVVLIGALFKITHWPGATLMLTIGLLTESAIFFFSGIEPPHEELDWTLVYPELKVSEDDTDILSSVEKSQKNKTTAIAPSVDAIAKFDEMLQKAGNDGLFDKLNSGLTKMSDSVNKLNDITDASVATKEFSENVKSASKSVNNLSETYSKSANDFSSAAGDLSSTFKSSVDSINYSVEGLSDSFNKTSETVNGKKDELNNAYQNLVSSMDLDFSSLSDGNKEYNDKISLLNKNLTAINAIFEMQLGEANLEEMVKDVQESAVYAKKYSQEITNLSKNLSALNGVYGKMLSAMNVNVD
ncbi:MAG: gliding motility protein GldL [Bacteroidales bacterium]|nr:gliding motility protein GldL [Bacteroidales bacterium]